MEAISFRRFLQSKKKRRCWWWDTSVSPSNHLWTKID